jgi:superfamily II DNA/RNA helicase
LTAARRRSASAGRSAGKHAGGKRHARTAGHHTAERNADSHPDRRFRADEYHQERRGSGRYRGEPDYVSEQRTTMPQSNRTTDTRGNRAGANRYSDDRRTAGRTRAPEFRAHRRDDEPGHGDRRPYGRRDQEFRADRHDAAERRTTGRRDDDNTGYRQDRRTTANRGERRDTRRGYPTARRDDWTTAGPDTRRTGKARTAAQRDEWRTPKSGSADRRGDKSRFGNEQRDDWRASRSNSTERRGDRSRFANDGRRDDWNTTARRTDKPRFAGERRRDREDAGTARTERRRDGRAARLDEVIGTEPVAAPPAPAVSSFDELGLPEPLSAALAKAGITTPFPIQAATLPDALAGRDVLGRAQTGSGKTLAFGLALLTRLQGGKARPKHTRALVLVPTRELAMQVADALVPLAKSLGLWCATVVGGLSFTRQTDVLRRGVDLVIATPGRLSDHVRQGTCVLSDVAFTAVDEADQMADMGFLPQVRAILDLTPDGQRMLFSATLDGDVKTLTREYLTDPVTHSVAPATASVTTMDHHLLFVSKEDKPAVIAEVANRDGRTIMFLRTKHHVDRLTTKLRSVGVNAGALHGGKTQSARNRVLDGFKDGGIPVLVATDVAARGIHVDGVSLVVHVDPPADAKAYLHRAGRTARAGESGTVVTLVTHQDRRAVHHLTKQAGVTPQSTNVRPGAPALVDITGAREPSGEPVVDSPHATRRPPRRRDFARQGRPRTRRRD